MNRSATISTWPGARPGFPGMLASVATASRVSTSQSRTDAG